MNLVLRRRESALFLVAICLPCLVLIALTARAFYQEGELQQRRRADRRERTISSLRLHLRLRLDSIAREALAVPETHDHAHPEIVLAGRVEDGRLLPPWESGREVRASRELLGRPGFEAHLRECERAEFGDAGARAAAQACEAALRAARHPAQAAYARLIWARVLDQSGRFDRALPLYRELAAVDPEITDEDRVPFALIAIQRLAADSSSAQRVFGAAAAILKQTRWLPPMATHALSDVADHLARGPLSAGERAGIDGIRREIAVRIGRTRQVQNLQADLPRLGILSDPGRWTLYGDEPWLVGAVPRGSGGPVVVAVLARPVLNPLAAQSGLRVAYTRDAGGEPLGGDFTGVRVMVPPAVADSDTDATGWPWLLPFAVALVAAATLFAGYLLWRDLQREVRAAELRTQFVASVSHELKTPLTAIRMYAETLQMGRAPDAAVANDYLETIVRESERLSRLVDGVLLFSKTEQGKHAYRMRPTDLPDVVDAAARAMQHPLSQQGFQLRARVEPDLPPVEADRDALEQAVLNLLSNAVKYSGDSRELDLSVGRENGEAVISVTDYGIGIAPEQQSRIFEKFYRAPTRENQLLPGTGLGLALVAQIAQAHRGRVDVRSAPGKGSTFLIRLPLEGKHEPDSRS